MEINSDIGVQQAQPVEIRQPQPISTVTSEAQQQQKFSESEFGKKEVAEAFIDAIEKANHIEVGTTECQFYIHEKTNQIMIKIVDKSTKEIIKEIPSEKILDMVAKMCDLAGVFVDEKR